MAKTMGRSPGGRGIIGVVAQDEPRVQIRTPERWSSGVYANGVVVWSTRNDFTLDFVVNLPMELPSGAGSDGESLQLLPQEIVARVKIPPPLVFQLMKNLNSAMETYEAEHGPIPDFSPRPPD